jgi:hypothetical protein
MRASMDSEGNAEVSSLEDEVAAWRSRRALRPEATIGKVRVVRIRKRVTLPADPRADHARPTAEPSWRCRNGAPFA